MPMLSATSDKYAVSSNGNSTLPTREIIIMPLSPAHGRGFNQRNVKVVPPCDANANPLGMHRTGQEGTLSDSLNTSVDGISTPQTLTHTTSLSNGSGGPEQRSPGGLEHVKTGAPPRTSESNHGQLSEGAEERLNGPQMTPEPSNGKVICFLRHISRMRATSRF